MSRTRVTTGAARAVARLAKQVEVAIGPLDLSLPQYRVLALLGDGSTASSVLARKLAVSPPTVTAVVDGLVARGLVERQADPEDRRRLTLLLTRDGKRVLAAADAAAESRLDEIAAFLEESEPLAAGLEGWNQALDRNREEHVRRGS
ncbi:MAG TPA: MarR family transcriptional regulator [Acidimicrobiia bacterium]|jgi:long-chain acyl-CoA synthetase|nr:MarR family transcriptional regulator [Acidimicrobiia bacterium]